MTVLCWYFKADLILSEVSAGISVYRIRFSECSTSNVVQGVLSDMWIILQRSAEGHSDSSV